MSRFVLGEGHNYVDVAELADALVLGTSAARRAGSTPVIHTKLIQLEHVIVMRADAHVE
jgi:hypothetical protein